jgi:hypothetical protein
MLLVSKNQSLIYWPSPEIRIQDTKEKTGPPVQYLNTMSHEQNLSSTSGQAAPIAQYLKKTEHKKQRVPGGGVFCFSSSFLNMGN